MAVIATFALGDRLLARAIHGTRGLCHGMPSSREVGGLPQACLMLSGKRQDRHFPAALSGNGRNDLAIIHVQ
jgi:hypothetical protein